MAPKFMDRIEIVLKGPISYRIFELENRIGSVEEVCDWK